MGHEENGMHIPESYKREILFMNNKEFGLGAFLFAFTKEGKKVANADYFVEYIDTDSGNQIAIDQSSNLKELELKMIEFITGRKWEVSKEKTSIPVW